LNERETSSGQNAAWTVKENAVWMPGSDGKVVAGSLYAFGGLQTKDWEMGLD
jgi:hypothetical protein